MIILDTNVLSDRWKSRPDPQVGRWFAMHDNTLLYLCAPILMELCFGAEKLQLKTGSRKLLASLDRVLVEGLGERILPFDIGASRLAGELRAKREAQGRPVGTVDLMIAAICKFHGATLATRNIRDFDGLDLKLVNPFDKR
jgi:predicted nucleic acid-binding protein